MKNAYFQTQTYYRAEIYLDAKRIKKMKGRFNTREDLDAFLEENWPGDLGYHTVDELQEELILKIYRYHGTFFYNVWKIARMPRPLGYSPKFGPEVDMP